MVIFAGKSYASHTFEAVNVSHDFPLAGVRMFGNVLGLRVRPVRALRCKLQTGAAAKQKSS